MFHFITKIIKCVLLVVVNLLPSNVLFELENITFFIKGHNFQGRRRRIHLHVQCTTEMRIWIFDFDFNFVINLNRSCFWFFPNSIILNLMKEVYDFCKKKRGFIIFVFKNNLASSYLQKYNILCFVFNSFLLVTRRYKLDSSTENTQMK